MSRDLQLTVCGKLRNILSDDDFADFQAAPTSAPTSAPAAPTKPSLMEMLNSTPSQTTRPSASINPMANNNLFGMLSPTSTATPPTYTNQNQMSVFGAGMTGTMTRPTSTPAAVVSTAAKPSSNFDDLWSMSLASSTSRPAVGGGKSIKDLEKEKAQVGIWGSGQNAGGASGGAMSGFGNFGGSPLASSNTGGPGSSGGVDDLLL